MPSSENEKILEVSIIRKQKDAISPSSNLRRSNRTLPNSPESTPAKKFKGTTPSSKAPVTKETDIGKSQPNILNPIQPPNIHMLGHFLSERVGRHVTSINPLVEVDQYFGMQWHLIFGDIVVVQRGRMHETSITPLVEVF